MCIASSPFRRRQEQYLRVNVKNFPVDERYQAIDSRDVPNCRQGNEKNYTSIHYSKKAENQRQKVNHKRILKEGYFIFKGTTMQLKNESSTEKTQDRR